MKFKNHALLAGFLLCAAGIMTTQANTIVTFSVDMSTNIVDGTFIPGTDIVYVHGTFDGWATQHPMIQVGSSTVYADTENDASDANGGVMDYQFVIDQSNYEDINNGHNRAVQLPATSGASLVLPTPFFNDDGAPVTNNVTFQVDMSQQINLGVFSNATGTVTVSGYFNGWNTTANPLTNDPSIVVTNANNVLTSNVWVGTFAIGASPWSGEDYKFVENGNYEANPILGNSGNNRFFTTDPNNNLTLPTVFFSDASFAPLSQVTFSVDMSAQLYYGNWTPSDGIFCAGINGDWSNDTVNTMTNNPIASNTNIYYATFTVGQGSANQYKFTYNGESGTVYESPTSTGGNNRAYNAPVGVTSTNLPTVYFSDLAIDDLLTTNMQVTFTVDMTNATQYGTGTPFNPDSDTVYVNGSWIGWLGWNPIDLAGYELTNSNPPGLLYSGTFSVPMGNLIPMAYKYSIDGTDNEAGSGDNHVRIIRSTATGAYSFPMDTFGNQYNEPSFGQLAVGPASAGTVPLTWLGAPNVTVQVSSNLTSGSWVSHPETSGAIWSAGTSSTNGLISATNWPAGSGSLFFRLIQQ